MLSKYLSPVSDDDQIFEFLMSLFLALSVTSLGFVICIFWKTLGKTSAFFWSKKSVFCLLKTVFFGQEVHCYMVFIPYYTELNLQMCNYAQK